MELIITFIVKILLQMTELIVHGLTLVQLVKLLKILAPIGMVWIQLKPATINFARTELTEQEMDANMIKGLQLAENITLVNQLVVRNRRQIAIFYQQDANIYLVFAIFLKQIVKLIKTIKLMMLCRLLVKY